jgi:NADH-quinone oxidoreductase subunit N
MWVVATLTMVVGAVAAVTQTDVKRLLAYSSIAHAGFILTAVISSSVAGLSSSLFYLATYGLSTIGAFALITLVRDKGGEADHLSRWAGLYKRSPVVAILFSLFLLTFAGIPLTSGFIGKFAVFQAAIAGGDLALVVIGVVSSAIAAFFYARVIVLMIFSDPVPDGPVVAVPSVFTGLAVGVGALSAVVLGVFPQPVLDLANRAATQLFVRLRLLSRSVNGRRPALPECGDGHWRKVGSCMLWPSGGTGVMLRGDDCVCWCVRTHG